MKLVLKFADQEIQEYIFDKPEIFIGRTSKNDITIDNLAVSSQHASIQNTKEGAVLLDNNSTNGTFVNDNKITRHVLKEKDVISIGKHQIEYYYDALFSSSGSDEEQQEDFDEDATIMISADFQKQIQQEGAVQKKAAKVVSKRSKKKKGLWGSIKALLGLS
ncbi:MAG: FHA domain-containing protein [gamma proteobacterium symbiont of Taylorina sp.]|nr:FHA domain-containing protein [gamma proteobacterium symbiont of Taylorina sp.]